MDIKKIENCLKEIVKLVNAIEQEINDGAEEVPSWDEDTIKASWDELEKEYLNNLKEKKND